MIKFLSIITFFPRFLCGQININEVLLFEVDIPTLWTDKILPIELKTVYNEDYNFEIEILLSDP